jgi:hypothetical protein
VLHLKNALADFFKLDLELIRGALSALLLLLVNLSIFHKHRSNGKVENKKATNPNHRDEIEMDEAWRVDVCVQVHDLGPAIHGRADEDCQEGGHDVVKLGHAVVEFLELGVDPEIGVGELEWGAVLVVDFESGAAITCVVRALGL